jgi:hypothetical protein
MGDKIRWLARGRRTVRMEVGKASVFWCSLAFFLGTGIISWLFGLNLLLSLLIAEAAAVIGLIVFEGIRQNRGH